MLNLSYLNLPVGPSRPSRPAIKHIFHIEAMTHRKTWVDTGKPNYPTRKLFILVFRANHTHTCPHTHSHFRTFIFETLPFPKTYTNFPCGPWFSPPTVVLRKCIVSVFHFCANFLIRPRPRWSPAVSTLLPSLGRRRTPSWELANTPSYRATQMHPSRLLEPKSTRRRPSGEQNNQDVLLAPEE